MDDAPDRSTRWYIYAFRPDKMRGIGYLKGRITGFGKLQKHLLAFAPGFVDRHAWFQVAMQAIAAHRLHHEVNRWEIQCQNPLQVRHALQAPVLIIDL